LPHNNKHMNRRFFFQRLCQRTLLGMFSSNACCIWIDPSNAGIKSTFDWFDNGFKVDLKRFWLVDDCSYQFLYKWNTFWVMYRQANLNFILKGTPYSKFVIYYPHITIVTLHILTREHQFLLAYPTIWDECYKLTLFGGFLVKLSSIMQSSKSTRILLCRVDLSRLIFI